MSIENSERQLKTHIPQLISIFRGGASGSRLTSGEVARASQALLKLQRGLTGDRELAGSKYMLDSLSLGAYILYYWPISYLQASIALSSAPGILDSFQTPRILDLGAGPGAASAAIADAIGQRNASFKLVDTSSKALKTAAAIIGSEADTITADLQDYEPEGTYDCIVMSHLLNEMWVGLPDRISRRAAFVSRAASHLSENGFLFMMEPALLDTSRDLIQVRDAICSDGFTAIAPCRSKERCPALQAGSSNTCHAEIIWEPIEPVSSLAKAAGLVRESLKMTYFIMKRTQIAPPMRLQATVVSEEMLNKSGRVRYLLCDGTKRFPFSADRNDRHAEKAGFNALRRYDIIEIHNPEDRSTPSGISYGMGEKTRIRLVSRIDQ
ncbi:MAG: small ribosomal subunit Rsm22 family protein [Sphaerochaetaceae bacterium]|nr:small ribosomal subunit Rsm22 family protein [Sphaerochaetaceae bacterium]